LFITFNELLLVNRSVWSVESAEVLRVHNVVIVPTLPYLTFGAGRLFQLSNAETVSVRSNAHP